jgi:hypothetical protein
MFTQSRYVIRNTQTSKFFNGFTDTRLLPSWRKHAREALTWSTRLLAEGFRGGSKYLAGLSVEIVDIAPTHEWQVQQFTSYGWEMVTTEDNKADMRRALREYRENQSGAFRAVLKRIK